MIGFIYGTIDSKEDNTIVLKCNDIGYELQTSFATAESLQCGEYVKLFTYLQVKEDGLSLFGFRTAEEKTLFLKLISVSGVGPKVAIAILSGLDASRLSEAILRSDIATLCKIKGLGKKTAERIVLELREKIAVTDFVASHNTTDLPIGDEAEEALNVLMNLGSTRSDALLKIKKACAAGAKTTQEILNAVFRG